MSVVSNDLLQPAIAGATPGKQVCGLRVLLDNGRPCTIKAAFIRTLGYFIDALFCGLVAYSAMKSSRLQQRYGDKWAGTVVVRARAVPEASQAANSLAVAWTAARGATIALQILELVLKAL